MNTQTDKAQAFGAMHVKGKPLVLHNIWDAGTARVALEAGAAAVATGSWSVAAAQGYPDGEKIPLDLLITIVERIVATVDIPVSVDIEGGYGRDAATLHRTIERVIAAGAIGINFEDQVVGENALYSIDEQAGRIRAIRQAADENGVPLFINARTDLFLQSGNAAEHPDLLKEAITRSSAYHDAGASGLFVPGLIDEMLVEELCDTTSLPVNIMMMEGAPSHARLAELGVSRISHGPLPFIMLMHELRSMLENSH